MSGFPLGLDLGEHVRLTQDQQVLAVDLDLGAAVLGVEDLVALRDVERGALAGVLVDLAVADGKDLALLGLLLRGVREDDARGRRLLLLDRLDDQAIAEGLELHVVTSTEIVEPAEHVGTRRGRVPNDADDTTRKPEVKGELALLTGECQRY